MKKLKRGYLHENMWNVLESERKSIAEEIKKKYGISEVVINDGFTSEALANKLKNKPLKFRIKKCGKNKGFLCTF